MRDVVSTTTALFVALMQHSDSVQDLVTDVMPTAFPWVRFLPRKDMQAFVVELVQKLETLPNLQRAIDGDLLARAREEDVRHWVERRRPISADTLRRRLGIGAGHARMPVSEIRGDLPAVPALVGARDMSSRPRHTTAAE